MRKGIDSLFNLIQAESPLSPMSGDVFVFFPKNRQSVKLLRWDTTAVPKASGKRPLPEALPHPLRRNLKLFRKSSQP
ncbi:MAG: IS66 family insertion sequence element accessory protein TnpB [Bacteroidales bacterium]|nr:IS66 family insertion sequence element accessory protein TnpB [Bacteroidales bacterium]